MIRQHYSHLGHEILAMNFCPADGPCFFNMRDWACELHACFTKSTNMMSARACALFETTGLADPHYACNKKNIKEKKMEQNLIPARART